MYSYHGGFLFISGEDGNSVLAGLTIRKGAYPDQTSFPSVCCGGGVLIEQSSPRITNCVITESLGVEGGGVFCYLSSAVISGCTISHNMADDSGGGIYCMESSVSIYDCVISDNMAGWGGGIAVTADDLPNSYLTHIKNCVIKDNEAYYTFDDAWGGGIVGWESSCIIEQCLITGNQADVGAGIAQFAHFHAEIKNCTIADNDIEGIRSEFSQLSVTNTIVYGNTGGSVLIAETPCKGCTYQSFQFSVIESGWQNVPGESAYVEEEGPAMLDIDPCFADPCNSDYHLKSEYGRWDPNSQSWVQDLATSPAIDAGDPNSDWTGELWPHGKRINIGAYGGTHQASMSSSNAGNIADLNQDNAVEFGDLDLFSGRWLFDQSLLPEDMDRNGTVDLSDYAFFARQWLWEE